MFTIFKGMFIRASLSLANSYLYIVNIKQAVSQHITIRDRTVWLEKHTITSSLEEFGKADVQILSVANLGVPSK